MWFLVGGRAYTKAQRKRNPEVQEDQGTERSSKPERVGKLNKEDAAHSGRGSLDFESSILFEYKSILFRGRKIQKTLHTTINEVDETGAYYTE